MLRCPATIKVEDKLGVEHHRFHSMNSLSFLGQRKDISKSRLTEEKPDSASDDKFSNRSLLMNSWRKSSRKLGSSCRNLFGADEKNKGARLDSGECTTKKKSQKEKSHSKDKCETNKHYVEDIATPDRRRKSLSSSKTSSSPKSVSEKFRTLTPCRMRKTMTNAEDNSPVSHDSPKPKSTCKQQDSNIGVMASKGERKRSTTPFRTEVSEKSSDSHKDSFVAKKETSERYETSTKKRSTTPYRKERAESKKETETVTACEKSRSSRENRSKQSSPVLHKQRSRRRLHNPKSSRPTSSRMHHSTSELNYDIKGDTRDTKSSSDLDYLHATASASDLDLQAEKGGRHATNSSSELNYHHGETGHRHSKSSNELDYHHAEKKHRHSKSSSDLNYDAEPQGRVTMTFPRVTKTYGAGPNIEKTTRSRQMIMLRDGNGSTRKLHYSFVKQKSYRGIEVQSQHSIADDCGKDDEKQEGEIAEENFEESSRNEHTRALRGEVSTQKSCGGLEVTSEHSSVEDYVKDCENQNRGIDEGNREESTRSQQMSKVRGRGSTRRLQSSFDRQKSHRGPDVSSEDSMVEHCEKNDNPVEQESKVMENDDSAHSPVSTAIALGGQSTSDAERSNLVTKPLVRAEVEKIEKRIGQHPDFSRSRSCRNLGKTDANTPYLYRPSLTKSLSMGRLGNRSFLSSGLTGSQKCNMVAAQASIIPATPKRFSTPHRRECNAENDKSDNSEEEIDTESARNLSTGRAARVDASRNRLPQSRNHKRPSPVARV